MPKGNYLARSRTSASVGVRRHRCDTCGNIFICEPCTTAMLAGLKRKSGETLYAHRHVPPDRQSFLCPRCVR